MSNLRTASLPAGLRRLTVSGSSGLVSLDGLASCRALEILDCRGSAALADIRALRGLPSLVALDLRGCVALSDLSVLATLPALRAVALHGTAVRRREVPRELRWACTWAKQVDWQARIARRPPEPTIDRVSLASVRRMLKSRVPEDIEQAAELAAGAGLLPELLSDVTAVPAQIRMCPGMPAYRLQSRKLTGPLRLYATLSLLALAPDDHLLRQIRRLVLWVRQPRAPNPIPLRARAAFPHLEALVLSGVGPLLRPAPLPRLEVLQIAHLESTMDLSCLSGSARLRALSVDEAPTGLDALPALELLRLTGGADLDPETAKALAASGVKVVGLKSLG